MSGIFILSGCGKSREEIVKEALNKKYGEDFIVLSIISEGSVYYATCSPVNNPEIIFKARMAGTNLNDDNYNYAIQANIINEIFKNDLNSLFPEAYFRTEYGRTGTTLYIYFDKDVGTLKEYSKEFSYFHDEVYKYINQGVMTEVTVVLCKVNKETIKKIDEYYKENAEGETVFFDTVMNVHYVMGEGNDLGNPPNISFCFIKSKPMYIDDFEKYKEKRRLIE